MINFVNYSREFRQGESRRIELGDLIHPDGTAIRAVAVSIGILKTSLEENMFIEEKEKLARLNNLPCQSRYLVKCLGVSEAAIYLEQGGSTLAFHLTKDNTTNATNHLFQRFAHSLCKAVLFLHENNFTHGNINPNHIVLMNGVAKLIDFKSLAYLGDPYQIATNRHFCFAPPEAWLAAATGNLTILDAPPELAMQGDIFQLGVTLLHCLNYAAIPNFVSAHNTPIDWYSPSYAWNHFQYMLTCYEQRPRLYSLGFLSLDPKRRITAVEALTMYRGLGHLPAEVPANPTFDFTADVGRAEESGSYKRCSFGTMSWNDKTVDVSKLEMRHNNRRRKPILDDKERTLLLRIDKKNSSYFPKIYHLGRSVLLVEACDCSFASVIQTGINPISGKTYSILELRKLLRDIFKGVALLHKMRIVHHDIKRHNCLIKGDQGKLIDVGLAEELRPSPPPVVCGTPYTAPPEAMFTPMYGSNTYPSEYQATSGDLWRLGILAMEFLYPASRPIFKDWARLMQNFAELTPREINTYYSEILTFARNTPDFQFNTLLSIDPIERKSIVEALNDFK